MPSRRSRPEPTPWQLLKPVIAAEVGDAMKHRQFLQPGVRMWRRRHDFVDVLDIRSKYGTSCTIHAGCQHIALGDPKPAEYSCIFRSGGRQSVSIPREGNLADFVRTKLLPVLLWFADFWFVRIASLEDAINILEHETRDFCLFNNPSPALELAREKLRTLTQESSSN